MARFKGTGKDERYPEGIVVDVAEDDADGLVGRGWIEAIGEADDPGRSPRQLADAAVRGDLFSAPEDRAAAVAASFIEEHEGTSTYTATAKARAVAGDEPAGEPASARRRRASR
jgi:hypothetical protein